MDQTIPTELRQIKPPATSKREECKRLFFYSN
nr:MAG TPA: hypothetical protein [Caudoviricetes sp.]